MTLLLFLGSVFLPLSPPTSALFFHTLQTPAYAIIFVLCSFAWLTALLAASGVWWLFFPLHGDSQEIAVFISFASTFITIFGIYLFFKRLERSSLMSSISMLLPQKSISAMFTVGTSISLLHCIMLCLPIVSYSTGKETLYTASCPAVNYFFVLSVQEFFSVLALLFSPISILFGLDRKKPMYVVLASIGIALSLLSPLAMRMVGGCGMAFGIAGAGSLLTIVSALLAMRSERVFPFHRH
uniref:Uncharacterized protein n=1 Tax=Palpitomonas bilix TaxID=652834 RepID=A0A7S3LVQ1_9EUKA|mmetsp:Transcript_50214/g.129252  ORF Transcript_50214/g.129252 Transcript_50214/m.129252 type:complete len:240 (+) Transcript_50214:295-1014(+)